MNDQQSIIRHLFNRESLDDVPVEALEQFANEHPLFGAGQFLLAKKYQQSGNDAFERQIQKASLYFSDPLWLHYQLITSSQPEVDAPVSHNWEIPPVVSEVAANVTEPEVSPVPEPEMPASSRDMIEEVVINQEAVEEVISVYNPEPVEEAVTAYPDESPAGNSGEADEVFIDTVGLPAGVFEGSDLHKEEKTGELASPTPQPVSQSASEEVLPPEENLPTTTSATEPEVVQPTHPLFPRKSAEDEPENKATFEPFHTVDYFASQGIKVSGEIRDDDRLGKQMKSFTEWLKTMRRLPEAKVEAELEKINDREIERLAAHSLDESEVVTEAMAEVYARQGKHHEAAAVYRKLSLLNPAKSAYFAAKIDGLNH